MQPGEENVPQIGRPPLMIDDQSNGGILETRQVGQ